MIFVHLRDVTEPCCGPFHTVHVHSYWYSHVISILHLYSSWSWNTINSSTPVHYLTAIQLGSRNTHTRHGQQCCHHLASSPGPSQILSRTRFFSTAAR